MNAWAYSSTGIVMAVAFLVICAVIISRNDNE